MNGKGMRGGAAEREIYGADLFGESLAPRGSGPLEDRFLFPPFSVLDTRSGGWQDRKRAWLSLGIESEIGRAENLLGFSRTILAEAKKSGTSIFDPVLCECIYRWFSPPGGRILDPFAGGSVRGIVAARLNRRYFGFDLRAEQVAENRKQASRILAPGSSARRSPATASVPDPENLPLALAEGRPVLRAGSLAPGASEALELFCATSSRPLQAKWRASDELIPYLRHLYAGGLEDLELESSGPTIPFASLVDNGTTWIQFTGGKDSLSACLKAEAEGRKVVCYHLRGLNRGMGDEHRVATRICEERGYRLVVDSVRASGKKTGLIESPVKNQVSLLCMLYRMAAEGGSHYSAGWASGDHSAERRWEYCFSDSPVSIELFNAYASARFPGARFSWSNRSVIESWSRVARAGLLRFVKGCVMPLRFRVAIRKKNEELFGSLLEGRCGSCVKCAWEQEALTRLGILPARPAFEKHGEKFIERDFRSDFRPDLAAIRAELIPEAEIEAFRSDSWPAQKAPPYSIWAPGESTSPGESEGEAEKAEPSPEPPREELAIWVAEDSRSISAETPHADLVFSCPPYGDLEQYSEDPRDLSRMDHPAFLEAYREIIAKACSRLHQNRFACFVVGDYRGGSGLYRNFVAETIAAFLSAGLGLYNEAILLNSAGTAGMRANRIFGASRKLVKVHQNVLVFVKGDWREAARICKTEEEESGGEEGEEIEDQVENEGEES